MRLSLFSFSLFSMKRIAYWLLAALCAPLLLSACVTLKGNSETPERLMVKQTRKNSVVIDHDHYTLSFNQKWLVPNWVSWELTPEEATTKRVKRENKFAEDPKAEEKYRVSNSDYSGELAHTSIKLSRGHMAPFADMRFDAKAAEECFYMTNMCPQSAKLNAGDWGTLENICRDKWAVQEEGIYIVCGPIFRSKHPQMIGKCHKVAVPDAFFKVVLSLKEGEEKAIGFIYENNNDSQPMRKAACSVDQIEKITHYDFFNWLPKNLEKQIEKKADLSQWGGN